MMRHVATFLMLTGAVSTYHFANERSDLAAPAFDEIGAALVEAEGVAARTPALVGARKDAISIEIGPPRIHTIIGRAVTLGVTIHNQSTKTIEVYDSTFERCLSWQRAVSLELSNDQGALPGNLLATFCGPNSPPSKTTWRDVPAGASGSANVSFYAGRVHLSESDTYEFAPGMYTLRLRAFGHLISGRPELSWQVRQLHAALGRKYANEDCPAWLRDWVLAPYLPETPHLEHGPQDYGEWEKSFPGPEICESNRVELEILPRTE